MSSPDRSYSDLFRVLQLVAALSPVVVSSAIVTAIAAGFPDPDGDNYRRLLALLDKGLELDAKGKELASEVSEPFTEKDVKFLSELAAFWYKLARVARAAQSEVSDKELADLLYSTSLRARHMENNIKLLVRFVKGLVGVARKSDEIGKYLDPLTLRNIEDALHDISKVHERVTGRICLWFYETYKDVSKYTPAALINDVTACHIGVVNKLRFLLDPGLVKVYEKVYAKNPNPLLLDGLKQWSDTIRRILDMDLLSPVGYQWLRAVIVGDTAEIRMNTEIYHDHYATVTVAEGKISVDLYNIPDHVEETIPVLIREIVGVEPKVEQRIIKSMGVQFTIVTKISFEAPIQKADAVFKALLPGITLTWDLEPPEVLHLFIFRYKSVVPEEELERLREEFGGKVGLIYAHAILRALENLGLLQRKKQ
jgi:hypothetical protein